MSTKGGIRDALFLVLTRGRVQDGKSMLKAIGNCRCSCHSPTIIRGNSNYKCYPKDITKDTEPSNNMQQPATKVTDTILKNPSSIKRDILTTLEGL